MTYSVHFFLRDNSLICTIAFIAFLHHFFTIFQDEIDRMLGIIRPRSKTNKPDSAPSPILITSTKVKAETVH